MISMLLIRLAVAFLIFYAIFAAVRSILRNRSLKSSRLDAELRGEEMVLDPQCRSYVPKSEAVAQAGKYFCSRECARRYLSSQGA